MDETIAQENRYAAELQRARKGSTIIAEQVISEAARRTAEHLNKKIGRGEATTAFMVAMVLAGFKDFADLVILSWLPVIGTVLGAFISLTLFFFLLGKGWFLRWRIRIIYLVVGFFFDNIPGFSALPMNMLAVLYAWHNVRKEADEATEKLKNLKNATASQLAEIESDFSEEFA